MELSTNRFEATYANCLPVQTDLKLHMQIVCHVNDRQHTLEGPPHDRPARDTQ